MQAYADAVPYGDVVSANPDAWAVLFDEALAAGDGDLGLARARVQSRADEVGAGFRMPGEADERAWPVSPLPLLIHEGEWRKIAAGVEQRATLMEMLIADIYGAQRLVADGLIPAALVAGSAQFLRPMVGITPPGGHHLRLYAVDLARGPDGEWRVLADHAHAPVGAGYALENRLAVARTLNGLQQKLNVERLAPFFAAFRAGLVAACNRSDPRLALLTAGRFNQSYAEQAHLARYLGLLLVEGADLAVHEDQVYLRTIEGMKRIDGLWQRMAASLLDPLALDAGSQIGVPGLVDAMAAGEVMIANAPGCGVIESAAFEAFLPLLSVRLMGEMLKLPTIATWWCGQAEEASYVRDNLDTLLIAPAFAARTLGLSAREGRIGGALDPDDRARLLTDLARRPMDYVGQEIVQLSTMPSVVNGALQPRPFTLRVFAARQPGGGWSVMPGGFVRLGEPADMSAALMGTGSQSADAIIYADESVMPVTLMSDGDDSIRRNPGTLPSRVADNLFWLGRYLERGEAVLTLIRTSQNGTESDAGEPLSAELSGHLRAQLLAASAVRRSDDTLSNLAQTALDDPQDPSSVFSLLLAARGIGDGSRERLATDFWALLDADFPTDGGIAHRASILRDRFAAFSGLAAEHMGRTAGWRFHDLGRRIERAITLCHWVRAFGAENASADGLAALLDLSNMRISYRQRYPTGLSRVRVIDLVALDPYNPRSIGYQVTTINAHLVKLPRLRDDGMAEPHQAAALALQARFAMLNAESLSAAVLQRTADDLLHLSDAIAERFFLRGATKLRAAGMTFA